MSGMLHVTKDSKKAWQQRKEEEHVTEKGHEPFDSALAWAYKACAWSASLAPEPQLAHHSSLQRRQALTTAALIY